MRKIEEVPFGTTDRIARYELDNGLVVLHLRDAAAPVVAYQTWIKVGSRHEKEGKTGLAHLFEHLMFNEAEGLPHGEFDRRLEAAGAETNAGTWLDWTFYYESAPKDAFPLLAELEATRLSKLVLREPQVASEKDVVANERRQRVDDDVDGSVSELLYATAFERHTYGWPTIGWMKDILAFSPTDCGAFYSTYYAPNNATLVVVGEIGEAELVEVVGRTYGGLASSTIPIEDVRPEPPQTAEKRLIVEKPTATEKVAIGYKGPALGDADHASLSVLADILFGGRGSRVHRALVQEKELAIDCRGWVSTFRDPGLFDLSVSARSGVTAEAALAALDEELDRVVREPVREDELRRVKARMELGTLQAMHTAAGKAEQIGFWDTVTGDPAGVFSRLAAVRRTTVTDVLRAARRYLVREARTVILVRPSGEAPADDEGEVDGEDPS